MGEQEQDMFAAAAAAAAEVGGPDDRAVGCQEMPTVREKRYLISWALPTVGIYNILVGGCTIYDLIITSPCAKYICNFEKYI